MNEPTRRTTRRIVRVISLALAMSLCTFLYIPACTGNVQEATIFYFDGGIKTGHTLDLEQGYIIRVGDIGNDGAAIGISDGGKEVANPDILKKSSHTFEKEMGGVDYDIITISLIGTDTDSNTVSVIVEQYIDPGRSFDYPLISDVSVNIAEGDLEPLKEGYKLGVTSIADGNAILTLYRGGVTVKQEKLYENDPDKGRFVYMKKIEGEYRTILIMELDRVFWDAKGGMVRLRGLSQFKDPEYVRTLKETS
ncbi:MAG TPA: hypothetical protein EYP67_03645, partial [Methanosarcinales archaeon]|nr:hypothetical protein [Methanosarcinales archaeon]